MAKTKPEIINKLTFYEVGANAPKNSRFKGKITALGLFGTKYEYERRYADKQEEISSEDKNLFNYNSRYAEVEDLKDNYTMSSDGFLDTQAKIDNFKDKGIQALDHNGAIFYELVFSPKDADTAMKYKLTSTKQYAPLVERVLPPFLKEYGFDPNNISWFLDFHPDNRTSAEPHPHIHLCFFENNQTRTKGKLPKKALGDFKMRMANAMLKNSNDPQYNQLVNDVVFSSEQVKKELKEINFKNTFKKHSENISTFVIIGIIGLVIVLILAMIGGFAGWGIFTLISNLGAKIGHFFTWCWNGFKGLMH